MTQETVFIHGPALSSFLDDMICMFVVDNEGLTIDPVLCAYFREAFAEAREKAIALEQFALAYMPELDAARSKAEREELVKSAASIGNVTIFPVGNRQGDPEPGGAA